MMAQPAAVRATWERNERRLPEVAELDRTERGVERAFLVGAGDSLAVMVAGRLALETMLGVPCEPMQSLDLAYYASPVRHASGRWSWRSRAPARRPGRSRPCSSPSTAGR